MEISTLFTFTTASVPSRICFCTANSGRNDRPRLLLQHLDDKGRIADFQNRRQGTVAGCQVLIQRLAIVRVFLRQKEGFLQNLIQSFVPGTRFCPTFQPSHGTVFTSLPGARTALAPERWGCHKHDWFLPVPWPSPSFHSSGAHPECRSYPKDHVSIMRMSSSGVPTVI